MKRQGMSGVVLSEKSGIKYHTLMSFMRSDKASMRYDKMERILNALSIGLSINKKIE